MELRRIRTQDGSLTYFNPRIGEHYHSIRGALQESRHVFLDTGTRFFMENHPECKNLDILEVGFGTGLNFLLTADYCKETKLLLNYCGIEKYPLNQTQISQMEYASYLQHPEIADALYRQYTTCIQATQQIHSGINLEIRACDVREFTTRSLYDLIYFDAFAVAYQPEMWEKETLERVCQYLRPGGVLVTYAITGNLKRNLKTLGFTIEKRPGAPGKREMLRAIRLASPSSLQNAHSSPADLR